MGVMKQALEILWPRGKAHAMLKDGRYLKAAFGDCFDDLRDELLVAIKNTRAGECTSIMMSEWCKMLGVKYDSTLGDDFLHARLVTADSGMNGTTLNELNALVQTEYPSVTVSEIKIEYDCREAECGLSVCGEDNSYYSEYYYSVSGTVNTDADAERIACILQHYAPLHLTPWSDLTVLSSTGTDETGVALCGIAECGYNEA